MDFQRQLKMFDPEKEGKVPISLIGAGAIGSMSALFLAKVGFSDITVYDHDKVEEHNIPNQFFPLDSVGHFKVEALQRIILDYTGVEIKPHPVKWEKQPLKGIVISAVDSMAVRKKLFDQMIVDENIKYLIDPRMGGLDLRVAAVNIKNHKKYSWYSDDQAIPAECGMQSIMFNVGIVSGIVCNMACIIAREGVPPSEVSADLGILGFTSME